MEIIWDFSLIILCLLFRLLLRAVGFGGFDHFSLLHNHAANKLALAALMTQDADAPFAAPEVVISVCLGRPDSRSGALISRAPFLYSAVSLVYQRLLAGHGPTTQRDEMDANCRLN
jgi:hypothetical protein